MVKHIISAFVLALLILGIGHYVLAWTNPTANPPADNVAAPVNIGSTSQTKTGSFFSSGTIGGATINATSSLCIAGDCKTAWSEVGGSNWTVSGSDIYRLSNVSIGTSAISSQLHVMNSTGDNILKLSRGASTSTTFRVGTDGAFVVQNQASDVLIIKSGNVGIGTTGPSYKLEVAGSFSGAGGNLVPESSFESSNKDYFWILSRWGTNDGSWSITTEDYKYGSKSLKAIVTSYTDGGIYFCSPGGTSGIPVKPSIKYTYSYWVRSSANESIRNNLYVYEYDSAGNRVVEHSGGAVYPPTTWTRYSRTFTTNASTRYVRLCAFYYNVGTFWWDGIQFEEGPTATQWKPSFAQKIEASNLNNLYLAGTVYSEGSGNNYFAGNVGIGTTNPGVKLEVAGQIKITGGNPGTGKVLTSDANGLASWQTPTGGGLPAGLDGQTLRHDGTNWVANSVLFNDGTNIGIGTKAPGNILTVVQGSKTDPIADAWTTYSSRRWKENVQPITDALGKVSKLRGVTFNWKADGKHDIGMIAEEVGEVLPELVDYEENGVDAKSLDYARLTSVLVEAIKELKVENDELKAENEELKARVDKLEKR